MSASFAGEGRTWLRAERPATDGDRLLESERADPSHMPGRIGPDGSRPRDRAGR